MLWSPKWTQSFTAEPCSTPWHALVVSPSSLERLAIESPSCSPSRAFRLPLSPSSALLTMSHSPNEVGKLFDSDRNRRRERPMNRIYRSQRG